MRAGSGAAVAVVLRNEAWARSFVPKHPGCLWQGASSSGCTCHFQTIVACCSPWTCLDWLLGSAQSATISLCPSCRQKQPDKCRRPDRRQAAATRPAAAAAGAAGEAQQARACNCTVGGTGGGADERSRGCGRAQSRTGRAGLESSCFRRLRPAVARAEAL